MNIKSNNITAVAHRVSVQKRWETNGHKGGVVWFTGLSGSGKTTLAFELEQLLFDMGYQAYVLDGDNIRYGLSADLGFSHEDRAENIRRIGEVASLFAEAGFIVISAFISPYREDRRLARRTVGTEFHEIFLSANLEACEARDPKGLYDKARRGVIKDFTGISAPYEEPEHSELRLNTGTISVAESTEILKEYILNHFIK
jgi:adenylyl-sulfate kinase